MGKPMVSSEEGYMAPAGHIHTTFSKAMRSVGLPLRM
jgi:hypothetical protein